MKKNIIFQLKEKQGYVSGEEFSRTLKISRAAVWKNIEDLRRQGYKIAAVPHQGYKLTGTPDKLLPWEIAFGLGTATLGRNIVFLEQVSSTMDEAFRLGLQGAEEGTLVCAETQRKGRGRMGRTWVSPAQKGIYCSLVLRPKFPLSEVVKLPLVCAVALCEALRNVSGINCRIKWPNDILVGGQKIAGLLLELSAETDRVNFVVAGFGINVNAGRRDIPKEATSLKMETGTTLARVVVLQEVLRCLEAWYHVFLETGFAPVRDRWRDMSATLGKKVSWPDAKGVASGEAVDIADDGGLLIRCADGTLLKKMSGDVSI